MTMKYDIEYNCKILEFNDMDDEVADRLLKANFKNSKNFMINYIRANKLMRFDVPYVNWDDADEDDQA